MKELLTQFNQQHIIINLMMFRSLQVKNIQPETFYMLVNQDSLDLILGYLEVLLVNKVSMDKLKFIYQLQNILRKYNPCSSSYIILIPRYYQIH